MNGITTDETPLITLDGGDDSLVRNVTALVDESLAGKTYTERRWKEWRSFYEGDQWDKDRASWRVSNVINVSFANVETATAVVMSMMPKLIAKPANRVAVDAADRVTSALNFLWKKLDCKKTTVLCLKDALIYGSGVFKVVWNPFAGVMKEFPATDEMGAPVMDEMGQPQMIVQDIGDISVRRVSPFHFHPDPLALSINDAAYIVESRAVGLDYIRRRWPEKAHLVKENTAGLPVLDKIWSSRASTVDVSRDPKYTGGQKHGSAPLRSQVELYEVWVRDLGLLYDSDLEIDWASLYEMYPNGRVIHVAGNVILQDMPNPFVDGRWPYVKFDDVERPDMFWGKGEIEPIEPLQKEINKRSSQIIENAQLVSNPKVLVPKGSGLKLDSMTSKPGEKWPYHGTTPPAYLVPPTMPNTVFTSLESAKRDVERVSGNYDMLAGQRPQGITSAAGISHLQEQAEKRPRMKMENLVGALREVGELILSRIRQYYDEPREVAISKDDGSGTVDFDSIWNEDLKGLYDIDIDVGSSLPSSQTLIFQQAMSLREIGVIKDDSDLLEVIDWPHRDRIIANNERVKQEEMQEQMMMMGMQGGQGGPPGPQGGPPQGGMPPPGPWSMREGGPPPPQDVPPELATLLQEMMQEAAATGQMPPELEEMLAGGMPPEGV